MNEHYYTRDPQSESRPVECEYDYRGEKLRFVTDAGVFSKGEVDTGTRLLLEALPEKMRGEILDLGCGWGVIGISIARKWPATRVTMAVECVESDGMAAFTGRTFDAVITNPPIRAGKQVIYQMFSDVSKSLKPGGALYLVIRKQQGAESCLKYLKTLYEEAEKLDKSGGYWVLKVSGPKDAH